MSEQSIAAARASVMIYDDVNKKWIPSGSSSGLSKVQIYHHTQHNTFRVVGRKLGDHEVVINCAISKGLKYNQATVTFHQWRDNKQVYGLNFSTREDAECFARVMLMSLDTLSNNSISRAQTTPPQVTPNSQQGGGGGYYAPNLYNGQTNEEEVEYRMSQKEDSATSLDRRLNNMQIESPNGPSGHHRTSSAPPAPHPPGGVPLPPCGPPAPPAPPPGPAWSTAPPAAVPWTSAPVVTTAGPPPPPPPPSMPRSSSSDGQETNSLAAQLQTARLRRVSTNTNTMPSNVKQSAENSGSSTSSSGSNYGTLGRTNMGSMASMMDEMAKTLARRRAAVERKDVNEDEQSSGQDKKWSDNKSDKVGNHTGDESPKVIRKRFGSEVAEDVLQKAQVNGMNHGIADDSSSSVILSSDLELLKQEILKEIRRDLTKMKHEILDAIKSDGIRR